jgi:hypothetical protein|tara:strand:- start:388 stop:576 length:189 start_codon:yes stop_codon:yes gene_type:complete
MIMAGIDLLGYLQSGQIETSLLAQTVHVWELYIFSHLGLAFVVATLIDMPGCELRPSIISFR